MSRDQDLASAPDRIAQGERVVLRPSKRRKAASLLLALWAGFIASVAIGTTVDGHLVGLVVLLFSGPPFAYWLAAAVPRSSALTVTRAGFVVRHCFLTRTWRWDDVARFRVREIIYPVGAASAS